MSKVTAYRWFRVLGTLLALTVFAPNVYAAALNAQIIERDLPQDMLPGGTYPVTITFHNTGSEPWYPGTGCNAVRLGSANPRDNLTWGFRRVNLPKVVAPGEPVRFDFFVRAPATPGTYNFQWQMLKECVTWFGQVSHPFTVKVSNGPLPTDAQFLSQSVPNRMPEPGGWYTATVSFKNTGLETWSPTGAGCGTFNLGPHNPQDTTRWTLQRAALPSAVVPGATMTMRFTVRAPLTPGHYNFQWQMIKECFHWFGDLTPNVVVTVGSPPTPTSTPTPTPTPTEPPQPTPPPFVTPGPCNTICKVTSNCAQSCSMDSAAGIQWTTCGSAGTCAR